MLSEVALHKDVGLEEEKEDLVSGRRSLTLIGRIRSDLLRSRFCLRFRYSWPFRLRLTLRFFSRKSAMSRLP